MTGARFTERELDVLSLHRRGLTPDEIADRLGITRSAVRTYIDRILDKLQEQP